MSKKKQAERSASAVKETLNSLKDHLRNANEVMTRCVDRLQKKADERAVATCPVKVR